jgi:hypothetical protein
MEADAETTVSKEPEEDVIEHLLSGYKRFRRENHTKLDSKLKKLSQEGQNCKVLCVSVSSIVYYSLCVSIAR